MDDPVITIKLSHFGNGMVKAIKVPSEEALPGMTQPERIIWALQAYAQSEDFKSSIKLIDDLFT
jgi:hypothetical protein